MTRTFIFDSADPNNSTFIDEVATYTSDEDLDEDFLSFEDDLQHSSTSSDSESSVASGRSGRSRLSRFRSRTSTYDNEYPSDDDGRSQRLVRAISRVVLSSGASVVGKNKHRTNSDDSNDNDDAGEGSSSRRSRRRNKKNRKAKRTSTELGLAGHPLEALEEPVQVISMPDVVPAEGIMGTQGFEAGQVKINLPDDSSVKQTHASSSASNINSETMKNNDIPTITINDDPLQKSLNRKTSQKKIRRRYSGSMGAAAAAQRRAGWEPGVDIRTTDIILQSVGSAVTIVDYSETRYRIIQTEVYPAPHTDDSLPDPSLVVNAEFHRHLNTRPSWSKVRWISVNGLSWEAISAISKRYQLHRLAIEDMVDIPQRTKVDLYPTHTFCCLPLHKLIAYKPMPKQEDNFWHWALRKDTKVKPRKSATKLGPAKSNVSVSSRKKKVEKAMQVPVLQRPEPVVTIPPGRPQRANPPQQVMPSRKIVIPDSSSSSSSSEDEDVEIKPLNEILAATRMETIHEWNNPYSVIQQKSMFIESKRPLAVFKRAVGVEQVSLFLTSQNTVISFFERSATDIERPLLARLSKESTILRESCDPSLLLQAIVDAIVDLIQPIVAAYRRRLDELEVDAMIHPSMSHTQDLHLMAGELSMLRNTIVPITSLVLSLRDHTVAAQEMELGQHHHTYQSNGAQNQHQNQHQHHQYQHQHQPGQGKVHQDSHHGVNDHRDSDCASIGGSADPIGGSRVTALAKVYLADISDHLLSHTQDLDVMRNNTKNMIDLIFNTISIQSSDSVKQLSVITVIFLPLSFWTGYFGMNFKVFGALDYNISYYWIVSVPFCVAVVLLAMVGSIVAGFRRAKILVKKKVRGHQRRVKKRMRKAARKKELSYA